MRPDINIAVVPLKADLDVMTVPAVRHSIDSLISSGCRRVILNMADVSFIDSAGMGLIIREIARMRAAGGLMSLINVSPVVLRALALRRVVDFIPVSTVVEQDEVPELEPGTLPLWRRVLRINPLDPAATRSKVSELLELLPLSSDERFDANLAVGEAVGNAVDHTDGQGALVEIVGYRDRVVVEVSDCGCGCADSWRAALADGGLGISRIADNAAEEDCWQARGRGLKLMRLLADSVTIVPKTVGSGTVVRIVKLARGV